MRILALLSILCMCLSIPRVSVLAQNDTCRSFPSPELVEESTRYFSLLFSEPLDISERFVISNKTVLDREYETYQKFFGINLNTPITIRVYKNLLEYTCTNVIGKQIAPGKVHTTIGQREIGVIGDQLILHSAAGKDVFLNGFRYELAGLFVNQLTDNKAPPGLLAGVQKYAQDPQFVFIQDDFASKDLSLPTQSWRYIWENQESLDNPFLQRYALSITAYLVDTYGWLRFVNFLNNIPKAQNYRQAMLSAYELDFPIMEKQWRLYFPIYFEERWTFNIFYKIDLLPVERLIAAGAYVDAIEAAKKSIEFLELLGQPVQEAQELLAIAQKGEKTGLLVTQVRRFLLAGAYEECIQAANQALADYASIGDSRRTDELTAYIERARTVLQLRDEVRGMMLSEFRDEDSLNQLLLYASRLASLGDAETPSAIDRVIREQEENRQAQQQKVLFFYSGAALLLLVGRVLLVRLRRPLEAL
jgi:hypothetical protein